ncbi:unannotated protein [freshwater metagenome]|uniref:Unannotated protein n=1 Tax=freshwater metagenome TaxID=449393 RepID=A0A6J7CEB8_9ZZZZ
MRSPDIWSMISLTKRSLSGVRSVTRESISTYSFGWSTAKDRSSNSHLIVCIPSRCASGAYISSVSRALRSADSDSTKPHVRALWRRSASLMRITRMSLDIATTILRTVSAWASSPSFSLSSLVTPSTRSPISAPKSRVTASSVYAVSSTVSCKSAAAIVFAPIPNSTRISATASGCVMYGSPDFRSCPSCAAFATW